MKNIMLKRIFFFIMTATVFMACESVIEIDLNSIHSKIVIEGQVTDQPGPYKILISKTSDYYDAGESENVTSAEVTISDDLGVTDTLREVNPGEYQTQSLQGATGRTYTLNILFDGENYTAQSTMPAATEIDSIDYKKADGGPGPRGGEDQYRLIVFFNDNPSIEDFVRLVVYRNDDKEPGFFLYNGRLSDGNSIIYDRFHGIEFERNDKVMVELQAIDEANYEFFNTLTDVLASDPRGFISTEVPANPVTNISNGALGYFGAASIREGFVE